jgi:hypothetical protein
VKNETSKESAAEIVARWLTDDSRRHVIALRYAGAGVEYLGNWVQGQVYAPSFLPLHPSDAAKMIALRDAFTREAFEAIDWDAVASQLCRNGGE